MEKENIYQKLFKVKQTGIKLQRTEKAYNYKYATLDQIQEKLNPILEKQWLLIVHSILDEKVRTSIIDTNAEKDWPQAMISEIPLSEWTKPQDKWSEITYYRRYNLLALLDLEVEDDDAQAAQSSSFKKEAKETKWFNYKDLVAISEAWNTTEEDVARVIKEDWYTLWQWAKNAVRHYVETGEIDKYLFFSK